jgi:phosphatidylglycerol:prolipoprotein diacylglycerol transferase
MLTYPHIDPIALSIGPLKVHWYGIMYLCAFGMAYFLGKVRSKKMNPVWTADQLSDLIFYGAMGIILGGRCGYVFFYSFDQFLANPLWLFQVWKGGMSFHGGFLGVLAAMLFFAKRYQLGFLASD